MILHIRISPYFCKSDIILCIDLCECITGKFIIITNPRVRSQIRFFIVTYTISFNMSIIIQFLYRH